MKRSMGYRATWSTSVATAATVLLFGAAIVATAQTAAQTPQVTPMPPPPPKPTTEKPAMSLPPPHFPTGPTQVKQFRVESIYNYERMAYQPPIVIQRVTRDKMSYATPEQALIAHLSAMLAGDYDWWLSGWDQGSQKFLKERNAQVNRSPADWRDIWAKALKGDQIVLVERIETGPFGPYVILVYSLRDKAGKESLRSTYVSKLEANRWVATQELAEDPLFHYYETGRDSVTITVR